MASYMRYLMLLVWVLAVFQISCGGDDSASNPSNRSPAATPSGGGGPVDTPDPESPGDSMLRFFTALEGNWSGTGSAIFNDPSAPSGSHDFSITASATEEAPQRWHLIAGRTFGDGTSADTSIVFIVQGNGLSAMPGGQTPAEMAVKVIRATPTLLEYSLTRTVDGNQGVQTTRSELVSPTLLREETTVTKNGTVIGREHFEVTK